MSEIIQPESAQIFSDVSSSCNYSISEKDSHGYNGPLPRSCSGNRYVLEIRYLSSQDCATPEY